MIVDDSRENRANRAALQFEARSSAPSLPTLAQEYLGLERQARRTAFEDLIGEYAERRGIICATCLSEDRNEALEKLDKEFFESLAQALPRLGLSIEDLKQLRELSIRIQYVARLEKLEQIVIENAHNIGAMHNRTGDEEKVQSNRAKLNEYVQSQSDLLINHLELLPAIEQLIHEHEEAGLSQRLECERLAISLHRAMRFGSRNAETACNILNALNAQESTLLQNAYVERYGISIRDSIIKAFDGVTKARTLCVLDGDTNLAQAHAICLALQRGLGTLGETRRFLTLKQIFESIRLENWTEIIKLFNENHAAKFKVKRLEEALSGKLKSLSLKCLTAIKQGDSMLADIILIRKSILGDGLGIQVINHTLEKYKNGALDEFKNYFQQRFAQDLRQYLNTFMSRGCQKDRALAVVDNDPKRFLAARVKCALGKFNGETVGDLFLGKTREERSLIVNAFEEIYSTTFVKELRRALSIFRRKEYKLILSLVKDGSLSAEQLLRYFIQGIGTNEDGIMAVLRDRSHSDIQNLINRYASKFKIERTWLRPQFYKRKNRMGRDLIHDLRAELSGDSWFECAMALRGKPDTLKELYFNIRLRLRHEKSGKIFKLFLKRIDWFPVDCKILVQDVKAMRDYYLANIRNKMPTREQTIKFQTLAQLASVGLTSFRGTKLTVATHAANTFAAGIGIGVGYYGLHYGLQQTLGLHIIALLVVSATLGTRALIHRGIRGNAYGMEQAVLHTAFSVFDGLGFGARKFANGLWGLGARFVGKVGAKQMLAYTDLIGQGKTTLKLIKSEDLKRLDGEVSCVENCELYDMVNLERAEASCDLINRGLEDGWARLICLLK